MAINAGQVQSTIKVKASTQNVDKTVMQIAKLQLTTEKIATQKARTANLQARENAISKQTTANLAKTAAQTEKYRLQNEKLAASINKTANKQSLFNKVISAGQLVAGFQAIKMLSSSFSNVVQKSADFVENQNLFNKVMGESEDKATDFLNSMNSVLGLDISNLMGYMGTFKGMANNMGIVEDKAYTMSEGLTKLTYDLASFYNTSVEQAYNSLSSAITGQTKSIREQFKGIDVTMGSLQTDLDILGIDKTTAELSYAEKSILRYISILRQSKAAHGDFANTMTSPAQMMKQFTERVTTLARAFGNVLIPILSATLPYILALISGFTKLFNILAQFTAKLFGYDPSSFDMSGASISIGSATDEMDGLGSSIDGASEKAKQLKKQLQGFDVLNVITTQKDTSGSGGAGGGTEVGSIDQRLLDAIDNYNNRLDLASDKVKILEAAFTSFLSNIDFKPLQKSLDNLWNSMKLVGNFTWQGLKDFYTEFLVPVSAWTIGEGLPRFINAISNGLAKIDWANLNEKLKGFWESVSRFTITTGEGLLWLWENVLVPFGTWTISDVAPVFIEGLGNAIDIASTAIETAQPVLEWLWENFLQPISKFAGGAVVGFLKGIANTLEMISKNKVAVTVLTTLALTALPSLFKNSKTASKEITSLNKVLGGAKSIFLTSTKNVYNLGEKLVFFVACLKDSKIGVKGLISELKNKINTLKTSTNTWTQNLSSLNKFRLGLVGATGLVVSLKATSSAMKDFAEQGKMTASTAGELALGIGGAAASGAALGSVIPGVGTAIGAVAGGLIAAVDSIISYNNANSESKRIIDELATSHDNYKEKMNSIQETLSQTIESTNNSAAAKLLEIENSQLLIDKLLTLVDVNGKVIEGNQNSANVIIQQLNEALGTELTLEDGVIKNGDQIISNKSQLIDLINKSSEAIKKETMLQTYQAQYKAAIEAQIEAKKIYNSKIAEEEQILQDALKDYKDHKITISELKDIAEDASNKKKGAEKDYQKTLKETDGIISGLGKVTETFANGTSEDMQKAIDEVTGGSIAGTSEVEKQYSSTTSEIQKLIDKSERKVCSFQDTAKKDIKAKFELNATPAMQTWAKVKQQIEQTPINGSYSLPTYKTTQKANGGIYSNGKWMDIPQYASGGLPNIGSMFVAGEAGPEWVGDIGGKTGVLNDGQLGKVIGNELYKVMEHFTGRQTTQNMTFPIYIGQDKVDEAQRRVQMRNNNIYGTAG